MIREGRLIIQRSGKCDIDVQLSDRIRPTARLSDTTLYIEERPTKALPHMNFEGADLARPTSLMMEAILIAEACSFTGRFVCLIQQPVEAQVHRLYRLQSSAGHLLEYANLND